MNLTVNAFGSYQQVMTLYGKLRVPKKVLILTPRLDSLASIYGCTCIHVKVHILLYHHNIKKFIFALYPQVQSLWL